MGESERLMKDFCDWFIVVSHLLICLDISGLARRGSIFLQYREVRKGVNES